MWLLSCRNPYGSWASIAIYHRAAGLSSQASSVNVCSIGCRIIYQALFKCKGCPVLPAGVHAVWRIPRTSQDLPWMSPHTQPSCCLDCMDIPGSSLDVHPHTALHAVWIVWTSQDPPWMSPHTQPSMLSGLYWHPRILPGCPPTHSPPCCLEVPKCL